MLATPLTLQARKNVEKVSLRSVRLDRTLVHVGPTFDS